MFCLEKFYLHNQPERSVCQVSFKMSGRVTMLLSFFFNSVVIYFSNIHSQIGCHFKVHNIAINFSRRKSVDAN